MIFLFGILLCLLNPVYGVVSAPYNQYCLPNNIEMKPEHYCGASAGCQPDPPGIFELLHLQLHYILCDNALTNLGAASMALDPADAAYAVAALHWPASDLAWGFAGTCFSLTGSRNGPWPAGVNLGTPIGFFFFESNYVRKWAGVCSIIRLGTHHTS